MPFRASGLWIQYNKPDSNLAENYLLNDKIGMENVETVAWIPP
jgi:hypothetical protein